MRAVNSGNPCGMWKKGFHDVESLSGRVHWVVVSAVVEKKLFVVMGKEPPQFASEGYENLRQRKMMIKMLSFKRQVGTAEHVARGHENSTAFGVASPRHCSRYFFIESTLRAVPFTRFFHPH